MSIQAVAWVLDHSASRGYARLVLISLANHHNAGTGQCNPGQRVIATEAGISAGSVGPNISKLVELGELTILEAGSSHRSARYALPFAQEMSVTTRGSEETTRGSGPTTRGNGESTRGPSRAESRTGNREPPPTRAPTRARDTERERIAAALGVAPVVERPDPELHYATDTEKSRVRGTAIADARRALGLDPKPEGEPE